MVSKRRQRVKYHDWDGVHVLDVGEMEIWDGADLALIRDMLVEMIEQKNHRSVGVNLKYVKYIPSGFFGMIFDWQERNIQINLYEPQPNVANMLWFRQFFDHVGNGRHLMLTEAKFDYVPSAKSSWKNEKMPWDEQISPLSRPVPSDAIL